MYSEKAPLELGDIFDRLFRLTGRTISRTIVVALILLGPVSIIYAFGMHQFFSGISGFIENADMHSRPDFQSIAPVMVRMMLFLGCIFLHYIAYLATFVAVTSIAGSELERQPTSWQDALGHGFGGKFLRTLGQAFLQNLSIAGIILVPFIMMILGKVSLWFILFGVLGFLVAIPYAIHLVIQWAFTIPAIALEGAGVFASFDRSASLVRGDWWRVFGVLLLLTIIIKFALTLISTPVNLLLMWGFLSKYLHFILSMKNGQSDPRVAFEMVRSMGFGIGIVSSLGTFLFALVFPILTTLMYFDRRFRKGEFASLASPDSSMPAQSAV